MPSDQLYDNSDTDEGDTPKGPAPKAANSDDDSDDATFGGNGDDGVTGLEAKPTAGTSTKARRSRREEDDDDEENSSGDDMFEEKKGDKRTLVVQEFTTRPDVEKTRLHMTKLPNLVGIQTEAFDESTYSAKQEQEDFGQAAYNLMRWRYNENGERESNTRLVEWEDGSMTLHIGVETFNIDSLDSSNKKTQFPGMNGYLYLSSNGAQYKLNKETEDDDEAKEEPAGTVLECLGAVQSRFVIKPSSLQSDAHKSLTLGIRQKTVRTAKIAEIVTQHDPEKLKAETAKLNADKDKKKSNNSGAKRSSNRYRPLGKDDEDFDEDDREDDDYDTANLGSMKRKSRRGAYDGEDESDDDYGSFPQAKKPKAAADSDDDEVVMDNTQDDDDTLVVSKRKKEQKPAILADDEDSDE